MLDIRAFLAFRQFPDLAEGPGERWGRWLRWGGVAGSGTNVLKVESLLSLVMKKICPTSYKAGTNRQGRSDSMLFFRPIEPSDPPFAAHVIRLAFKKILVQDLKGIPKSSQGFLGLLGLVQRPMATGQLF